MTSSLCCPVLLVPDLGTGGDLRFQHLPAFGFSPPSRLLFSLTTFPRFSCGLSKNLPMKHQRARSFSLLISRHWRLDAPGGGFESRAIRENGPQQPKKRPLRWGEAASSRQRCSGTRQRAVSYLRKRSWSRSQARFQPRSKPRPRSYRKKRSPPRTPVKSHLPGIQ